MTTIGANLAGRILPRPAAMPAPAPADAGLVSASASTSALSSFTAPASAPPTVLAGPVDWAPSSPLEVPSARRPGMAVAVIDAWRGVMEKGNGQPLTSTQVSELAPFYATAYGLPEAEVRANLRQVRLYLGGPAAHTPWNAVTLGHDIYVRSADELKSIVSWDNRRWLAHECGHVMQGERIQAPTEQARVRGFLREYGTHLFADSWIRPGAVQRGVACWLRENVSPFNHHKTHISLSDAVHDAHAMEREAEQHAVEWAQSTPGTASMSHFDRGRP